jgi:cell division protein FtsN
MEQKKLLWVIFSAVGFVFIVAAAGLVLFWPHDTTRDSDGEQPAAGVTRDFDPVEWVRQDQEYPGIEKEDEEVSAEEDDAMVLVYGETDAGDSESSAEEAPRRSEKEGVEIEVYRPEKRETKPAAEAAAPAEPKPDPAPRRLTEYWIQAGSYTSMVRADEVKQDLSKKGIASVITTKTVDDADYYRVRIGPYGSEEEAEKFLGWIQGVSGFESSYVSMVYVTRRIN